MLTALYNCYQHTRQAVVLVIWLIFYGMQVVHVHDKHHIVESHYSSHSSTFEISAEDFHIDLSEHTYSENGSCDSHCSMETPKQHCPLCAGLLTVYLPSSYHQCISHLSVDIDYYTEDVNPSSYLPSLYSSARAPPFYPVV